MTDDRLILIDWGTTRFRAWLGERASGAVVDTIADGPGLTAMAGRSFPETCAALLGDWRDTGAATPPVLMAGMVGAPSGWLKAAQPPLPIGLAELAAHRVPAEGMANAWILPGAHKRGAGGDVDVMRGEEVQILGALALMERTSGRFCLPGTHSKWARAEAGRVVDFATFLTGEMRAALLNHTILGQPAKADAPFDEGAFDAGLEQAAGAEVAGALTLDEAPSADPVILIGGSALQAPYERALSRRGVPFTWVPADRATRAGMLKIGEAVDLRTG
jgi:2-dehydro-3-deoxygalactonokinase